MKNPLRKIDYNAPVILTFVFLSLIVTLLGEITNGSVTRLLFRVYRSSWSDWKTYIRLFGHVLGHSNWSHYLGNMMTLMLVGPMVEQHYGSRDLAFMIVLTALVTGLLNNLFFNTALLGASGIVFMLIVLSSATSMKEDTIPLTMILVICVFLGQQIYEGLTKNDNISQFAHIAGGVLGGIYAFIASPRSRKKAAPEGKAKEVLEKLDNSSSEK